MAKRMYMQGARPIPVYDDYDELVAYTSLTLSRVLLVDGPKAMFRRMIATSLAEKLELIRVNPYEVVENQTGRLSDKFSPDMSVDMKSGIYHTLDLISRLSLQNNQKIMLERSFLDLIFSGEDLGEEAKRWVADKLASISAVAVVVLPPDLDLWDASNSNSEVYGPVVRYLNDLVFPTMLTHCFWCQPEEK